MCLYLKYQNQTKPSIAEKDIKVYKVLEETSKGRFVSPFREKRYVFGVRYHNEIGKIHKEKGVFYKYAKSKIESGLHSFTNSNDAAFLCINKPTIVSKVFISKIPKGSEYFLGDDGDVVSNRLVVSNHVYNPNPNLFQRIVEWWKFKNI